MARLLLVLHAPTRATRELADAVEAGANDDVIEGVEVDRRSPDATDADAITSADGLVLLSPANFGYMAGLVKDLFDRTFLDIGGALASDGSGDGVTPASGGKLPFGLCVHGRYDTEGATRSILSIAQALPWSPAAAPVELLGDVDDDARAAAYELGATVAALLSS